MRRIDHAQPITTHRLAAFADASETDGADNVRLEFPEDYEDFSTSDLNDLHTKALNAFEGLYGDGTDLSDEDMNALSALTEGIESVKAEQAARAEKDAERAERARELASKIGVGQKAPEEDADEDAEDPADESEEDEDEDDAETPEGEAESEDESQDENEEQGSLAASGRRRSVSFPASRARRHLPRATEDTAQKAKTMKDVAFASGEGTGFTPGTGIDFADAAQIVARRLQGFNHNAYAAAAKRGKHMRQQSSVMGIRKPIGSDLVINRDDPEHTEGVLSKAVSEHRLPGNSLVAAGGWCAPSETLYDLLEMESRDGLFSLPEVGVARGGIRRTLGPDFADIFRSITGFHYTEEQDQDGLYGVDEFGIGDGSEGDKPCYKVECPDFEEFRLEVIGLCLSAGLLQQRAYPEVIARTLRGALVAHDHRISARTIRRIESGSDAVNMTSTHGSAAPLLQAIELQVEHLRYTSRMPRGATVEGVFPFWVRGAIRADLAERNGVDMLAVSDQQIANWFTLRGISPQFVYNWQDINVLDAANFTGWPTEVKFLLYPAGTWVRGSSDIITIDSLFDSTQLRQNDYTALFTEEGWMVVKMGHYSRVVTVPINADGVTGIQADLAGPTVAAPLADPEGDAETAPAE